MEYYHVFSSHEGTCAITPRSLQAALRDWLCSDCQAVLPVQHAVDVEFEDRLPTKVAMLNADPARFLTVCRRRFVEELGWDVCENAFLFGSVSGPNGLLDEWVTLRGKRRILIRGNQRVSNRRCTTCNSEIYFAIGDRFLWPPPPSDMLLCESHLGGMLIREDLYKNFEPKKRWKRIYVQKVGVTDECPDALGALSYC